MVGDYKVEQFVNYDILSNGPVQIQKLGVEVNYGGRRDI